MALTPILLRPCLACLPWSWQIYVLSVNTQQAFKKLMQIYSGFSTVGFGKFWFNNFDQLNYIQWILRFTFCHNISFQLVVLQKFGSNYQETGVFILAPTTSKPHLVERFSGKFSSVPNNWNQYIHFSGSSNKHPSVRRCSYKKSNKLH